MDRNYPCCKKCKDPTFSVCLTYGGTCRKYKIQRLFNKLFKIRIAKKERIIEEDNK